MGINYYYFNDAINTLVNGFLKLRFFQILNEGKINTVGDRFTNIKNLLVPIWDIVGASWRHLWRDVALHLCV
jgi:hypothetical protein